MTGPIVLVVEDEDAFAEALLIGLKREGFDPRVARDGVSALAMFNTVRPDLVLVDLMLPGMSGIDLCRHIRRTSTTPIIIVTARDSEVDTVVGLEVGADDYVTKPYRLRELVARMRAVMRRAPFQPDDSEDEQPLQIGGIRLDPARHEVTRDGQVIELARKEFELLEMLIRNAGRALTRDRLIDEVWGPDYIGDTKTLDVHIRRLRTKIDVDPSRTSAITTVRGVGYRFELALRNSDDRNP